MAYVVQEMIPFTTPATTVTLSPGLYRIWLIGNGGNGGSGGKGWGFYKGGGGGSGGNGGICVNVIPIETSEAKLTFTDTSTLVTLFVDGNKVSEVGHGSPGEVGSNASALNGSPKGGSAGKGGSAQNFSSYSFASSSYTDIQNYSLKSLEICQPGTDGNVGAYKIGASANPPYTTTYTTPKYVAKNTQAGYSSLVAPYCLGCAGGGGDGDSNSSGGVGAPGGIILEKYVPEFEEIFLGNTKVVEVFLGSTPVSFKSV